MRIERYFYTDARKEQKRRRAQMYEYPVTEQEIEPAQWVELDHTNAADISDTCTLINPLKYKATPHNCVYGAFWKNSARILLRKLGIQPVFLRFRAAFGHYFSGEIALAELCGIAINDL